MLILIFTWIFKPQTEFTHIAYVLVDCAQCTNVYKNRVGR